MQVYRGLDIGTAKPTPAVQSVLPHHLIDVADPHEQFNVGCFVRLADAACADIRARGRIPIVCGGSGYYLANFVFGLPESPPGDPVVRAAVQTRLSEAGPSALHAELAEVDPVTAARLHPNDAYRVSRALEIFRTSSRAASTFPAPSRPRDTWRFTLIGLTRPREELNARIEARVDEMFAAGLCDEVAGLQAAGYAGADPGMRAIGYREFLSNDDPAEVRGLIKRNSRRYAKRQITFFKGFPDVNWVPINQIDQVGALIEGTADRPSDRAHRLAVQ